MEVRAMTICVAAAPTALVCALIICDIARPSTSAPNITPTGKPILSCARMARAFGRHMSRAR